MAEGVVVAHERRLEPVRRSSQQLWFAWAIHVGIGEDT